jgi:hypothetical protein
MSIMRIGADLTRAKVFTTDTFAPVRYAQMREFTSATLPTTLRIEDESAKTG